MKKIFSIFISLVLAVSSFSAVIAKEVEGTPWILPLSDISLSENASYGTDGLRINGGKAVYKFTLPIYSDKIVITSLSAGKVIDIAIDSFQKEVILLRGENEIVLPTPLRVGEKTLSIAASAETAISGVSFSEIKSQLAKKKDTLNLTEFEEAVGTAVIFKESSQIIMVNGAKRYISYEKKNIIPLYFDGNLCLPLNALAKAAGLYSEEIKENNYALLRKQNKDIVFDGNNTYTCENAGEYKPCTIKSYEKDGIKYVPVRAVLEYFGEYVLYKNGFVIIDYRTRANEIANKYLSELTKEFENTYYTVSGATYYVSQEAHASDSNFGTIESPFLTIGKAAEVAKAGDTVVIRGGTYRETVKPQNSGTPENPIIFKAYDGENVIVSAMEKIDNFINYKDGMVMASVPWDLGIGRNQILYKGKNLVEARYPNSEVDENGLVYHEFNGLKLSPEWITEGDIHVSVKDKSVAYSDTLLQEEDNYWKDATFVSQHGAGWTFGTAVVESSTKGHLKLKDMSTQWWFDGSETSPDFGYLTNTAKAIDLPGEWFMNEHYIYMLPPENETAETLEIELKKRMLTFDLSENSCVWLDGINTVGGSMKMNNSEMCVIKNCNMRYLTQATRSMDFRSMFFEEFNPTDPNGAPTRGEAGIYIGGENNAFVNNDIQYSAASALYITGRYFYCDNNIIGNCGYMGVQSGPVHIDTEAWRDRNYPRGGHSFYNNTMFNSNRTTFNISRFEPWHNTYNVVASYLPMEMAYNDFYNGGIFSMDTGIFYVWGSNLGSELLNTKMHNNRIHQYQKKGESLVGAIYHDNFMAGMDTYDNLIYSQMPGQYRYDVYEQLRSAFPLSYATVDAWNNMNIGIRMDDSKKLVQSDFGGAKPFFSGAYSVNDKFTLNYEIFKKGKASNVYDVSDITENNGVVIENNLGKFSADGQWIKFSDVDFSDNMNTLNLSFRGDFYNSGDSVDIIVGDLETGMTAPFTISAESKSLDDTNSLMFNMFGVTGTHDIYVRCNTYKSFVFEKFYLSSQEVARYDYDYKKIYAGRFGEYRKSPNNPQPNAKIDSNCDSENPIIQNSWGQSWVKYDDVKIDSAVTKVNFSASTGGKWAGSVVSICLGSPYAEPIAQFTVEDHGWNTYPVYTAELKEVLETGTYDIYITFTGDDKCSNIYWFGLE